MGFTDTLQQIVAPLVHEADRREDGNARAAAVVAHHAPHLLRRLAEMSAVLDAPGLHSGMGTILACRSGADGYRSVEYDAPELAISFDVKEGEAHLRWHVGGETDDRPISMETPEAAFDAAILDAVSAYVTTRLAHAR
jgi:hypothetical protein